MTSFSSLLDPSLRGMLLDTIEDFDMVATFGGAAVLYPARYEHTNLPENLHAAVAATTLRLRSLDYAKSRYGQTRRRQPHKSSHDLYIDAYRLAKAHIGACSNAFEPNAELEVGFGTFAASIALQRLVTSVLGAHLLYRIGLNFEGDAVARHVLEQIAWAVAAAELDDEEQLRQLSPTRAVSKLKPLAPYAGPLYGRLSETTHASLTQHRRVVRSEGETLSVLLAWDRPAWSALTLLQLADLWVLAYEWTQQGHMKSFLALDRSAGYAPLVDRPFLKHMRELVLRIEAEETSEHDRLPSPDVQADDGSSSASIAPEGPVQRDQAPWIQLLEARNPSRGIIASHTAALDKHAPWRRAALQRRIAFRNIPARTKRAVESLTAYTDLRAADLPGLDRSDPLRYALLSTLVFAPGYVFLEPWLRGIALGPLADIPVYSSNARSQWAGKAHASGLCQHRRQINTDDDLLTLAEWVATYRERQFSSPFDDWLCSKCGGFSVALLNDKQAEHFQRATELCDALERVSIYEQNLPMAQDEVHRFSERAIDTASAIAAVCPELRNGCVALTRRAAQLGEAATVRDV